jgi:hypothetical protein
MYFPGMKVGKLLNDLTQMTYNWWALSPLFFNKLIISVTYALCSISTLVETMGISTSMQK